MKTRFGVDHEASVRARELCRQCIVEALPLIAVALALAGVEAMVISKFFSVSATYARLLLGIVATIIGLVEFGVLCILGVMVVHITVEIRTGSYKVDE